MLTRKEQLLTWCKQNKVVSSVMIRQWGLDHYYISADRVVRQLAEKGELTKVTPTEAILRGLTREGKAKIGWWEAR